MPGPERKLRKIAVCVSSHELGGGSPVFIPLAACVAYAATRCTIPNPQPRQTSSPASHLYRCQSSYSGFRKRWVLEGFPKQCDLAMSAGDWDCCWWWCGCVVGGVFFCVIIVQMPHKGVLRSWVMVNLMTVGKGERMRGRALFVVNAGD